jgi:hypothetical protein
MEAPPPAASLFQVIPVLFAGNNLMASGRLFSQYVCVDIAERRKALGEVVEAAGILEMVLRVAFCALVGSKYSAIVAGGQDASWLLDNCSALVKANRELTQQGRQDILDILSRCRAAQTSRNRMIHDAWSTNDTQLRSPRRSYELNERPPVPVEEIKDVSQALHTGAADLTSTLIEQLGSDALTMFSQLRWLDEDDAEPKV